MNSKLRYETLFETIRISVVESIDDKGIYTYDFKVMNGNDMLIGIDEYTKFEKSSEDIKKEVKNLVIDRVDEVQKELDILNKVLEKIINT